MKYGYARISDKSQNFTRQIESLKAYGIDEKYIFKDSSSGKDDKRPEFQRLLNTIEEGDTIVIHELDRLMRSTRHLLQIIDYLKEKKVALVSINDPWLDTTIDNPFSEMLLIVLSALNQYERKIIKRRQEEGIKLALADKNRDYGRPKKNKTKVEHAISLYQGKKHTIKQIEQITGVSKATLYRRLKEVQA